MCVSWPSLERGTNEEKALHIAPPATRLRIPLVGNRGIYGTPSSPPSWMLNLYAEITTDGEVGHASLCVCIEIPPRDRAICCSPGLRRVFHRKRARGLLAGKSKHGHTRLRSSILRLHVVQVSNIILALVIILRQAAKVAGACH